jgi:hypothetical protein
VALVAAPAAWKGPSLPRVEVLLAAHQKWEIECDLIDASTLFRKAKTKHPGTTGSAAVTVD